LALAQYCERGAEKIRTAVRKNSADEIDWRLIVNTAIDITTARANRIRNLIAESDLAGKNQINLRLTAGSELAQLRAELTAAGRTGQHPCGKTKSTFRWGEYCRSDLRIKPDTAGQYIRLAEWAATNPELSESFVESSDSWTEYRELVRQQSAPERPQRAPRRAPRTETPAVTSTGISLSSALRINKLRGMCSDSGPEGDTARRRVQKLSGTDPERLFDSSLSTGLVTCAGDLSRGNREWLNTATSNIARLVREIAEVDPRVTTDQLIADIAATVREQL
jgi:hypothetical protein